MRLLPPSACFWMGARVALLAAVAGCGGAGPRVAGTPAARVDDLRQVAGHPPVVLLAREGDPSAAVAVSVLTVGVDAARGAEVPVALAGVVEARLDVAGLHDAHVVPGAEGLRVRALLPEGRASEVAAALRGALLTPIADGAPEAEAAMRKLAALARRVLPDPALDGVARCTGEPFASRAAAGATASLEAWRAASVGLGRIVLSAVGPREVVDAFAAAVAQGPAWPTAAQTSASTPAPPGETLAVYDASPDLPAGAARVSIVAETADLPSAAAAAERLGDPRAGLGERLSAVDRHAALLDLTATAHPGYGCLSATFDLPSPAGAADPPTELALAVDVAKKTIESTLAEPARAGWPSARDLANRAGDPREAAERLAYSTLMSAPPASARGPASGVAAYVGLGAARGRTADDAWDARASAVRAQIAQTEKAPPEPAAEVRVRAERGQAGAWLLLASPCGTDSETSNDAGASALVALAVTERARHELRPGDAADAWIAADGVGLVVHAVAAPGEPAASVARRAARIAARSFAAAELDPHDLAAARAALSARRSPDDSRTLSVLGEALAPGHPSWVFPSGTADAIERSSDDAVKARLEALRAGPLRVAFLGDPSESQVLVAEAIAQHLPSRPGARRACVGGAPPQARPGTYTVPLSGAPAATAWLALALPADAPTLAAATVIASALGARGGLLERALGAGLARSWGARVLAGRAPTLLVQVSSAQGSLDAAVAEVRVLLDRVRQEGLNDADRSRAVAAAAEERLEASLDPEARLVALFRGEDASAALPPPTADDLRAFSARVLRDDALILVAGRPPHAPLR